MKKKEFAPFDVQFKNGNSLQLCMYCSEPSFLRRDDCPKCNNIRVMMNYKKVPEDCIILSDGNIEEAVCCRYKRRHNLNGWKNTLLAINKSVHEHTQAKRRIRYIEDNVLNYEYNYYEVIITGE